MMKNKYIYGLFYTFNTLDREKKRDKHIFYADLSKKEPTVLWDDIPLTLEHDYSRTLGTTAKNDLKIVKNDVGLYFRFKVDDNNPLALETFEKVDKFQLRQCSCTYRLKKIEDEIESVKATSLLRLLKEEIINKFEQTEKEMPEDIFLMLNSLPQEIKVSTHFDVLMEELCLTNNPANPLTFCTTRAWDERLKGVNFDETIK